MYIEARKLHLIEEALKTNNDAILKKTGVSIENLRQGQKKELGIFDFVGVISEKNAAIMETTIEGTFETINEKDWK